MKTKKKTESKGIVYDFNPIDTNNILDIDRHLVKRKKYKKCLD